MNYIDDLNSTKESRPFSAAPADQWPLPAEERERFIERLKREDASASALVLEHFKSGDKEAAELLVRTFYPYAESLLVSLEKRDPQSRVYGQSGIAPALTETGSRREEFLNDFFVNFVKGYADLDLSKGIRLYLFKSFIEIFDEKVRSASGSNGGVAVGLRSRRQIQSSSEAYAVLLSDEDAGQGEDTQLHKLQNSAQSSDLLLDRPARPDRTKRMTGVPAGWTLSKSGTERSQKGEEETEVVHPAPLSGPVRGKTQAPAYASGRRRESSVPARAAGGNKTAAAVPGTKYRGAGIHSSVPENYSPNVESRQNSSGRGTSGGQVRSAAYKAVSAAKAADPAAVKSRADASAKPSAAVFVRSGGSSLFSSAVHQDAAVKRDDDALPAVSPLMNARTQDAGSAERPAPLSRKAKAVSYALAKLASVDVEAYWAVVMRYFALHSFKQLCSELEASSMTDVSGRIGRGLMFLSKDASGTKGNL